MALKESVNKEPILVKVSLFFIKFYQKFFSIYFGGNCRFYPSCSEYAVEAYQSHSWYRASKIVFKRLLKCHPFGPSGYDPIPDKINTSN